MGFYILKVTCTGCALQTMVREGPSGCAYRLPDGERVSIRSVPAWCAGCATVINAEHLPPLADVEHELADFESQGPGYQSFVELASQFDPSHGLVERHLADLRTTLAWRRMRRGPPRCLRCGSPDITYLTRATPDAHPTGVHPSCGGTLTLTGFAHASGVSEQWYSVEGERLADEGG
ncbi:Hypothetical protein A7982_09572 [Minicystis rosea]|nr:Hypothetical protein A7982_09572 [Minicystis rosea]